MKKLILTAAVMFLTTLYVRAEISPVPRADSNQQVYSADYSGVKVSTNEFSSSSKQAFIGGGVIHGAVISSGASTEFLTVVDTSGTVGSLSSNVLRLYNSGGASGTIATLTYPVRVKYGASFNYSVGTNPNVTLLYWNETGK